MQPRSQAFFGVLWGLCASVLAGCGAQSTSLPQAVTIAQPATGRAVIPFKFVTVNNPNDPYYTLVTGVNQLGKIVGYSGHGTTGNPARGFAAEPPYDKFRGINYPGGLDTYPTSLTNTYIVGGYFVNTLFGSKQTWMFVDDHGLYTLYKDHKGPGGHQTVQELLGINDSDVAVGFYEDQGKDEPFEFEILTKFFVPLHPPGAVSAEATAINGKGDAAGFEMLSNGTIRSWVWINPLYTTFSYPKAKWTKALGINWQDQIVGEYQDSTGKTHGFVLSYVVHAKHARLWQSVDDPNAGRTTVVSSLNNHDEIAGWYVDASGHTHGFIATDSSR